MRWRKRSFKITGIHRVFCTVILWIHGCTCAELKPENAVVRIAHRGGEPFALKWVLPVEFEASTSGWWSNSTWVPTGDTAWTDHNGKVILLNFAPHTQGLICQLFEGEDVPYYINLARDTNPYSSDVNLTIPQNVWFRFIGNREGEPLGQPMSIRPDLTASDAETWQWFTPGTYPQPVAIIKDWIHPLETAPERRFHLYTAAGEFHQTLSTFIPETALGDTLIIPIHF